MEEILKILQEMAIQAGKNGKLNKENQEKCGEAIKIALLGLGWNENTGPLLAKLPAEVLADSIHRAWQELGEPERRRIENQMLNAKELNNESGLNRKIAVAGALAIDFPESAGKIIGQVASKVFEGGPDKVNAKLSKAIRAMVDRFLNTNAIKVFDAPLPSWFSDGRGKSLSALLLETVKQLNGSDQLSKGLPGDISSRLSGWLIDSGVNPEFVVKYVKPVTIEEPNKVEPEKTEKVQSPSDALPRADRPIVDDALRDGLMMIESLRRWAEAYPKRFQRVAAELSETKTKLEYEKQGRMQLQNRLDEFKAEAEKQANIAKNVAEQLHECKQELAELYAALEEEKAIGQKMLARQVSQTEHEARYLCEEFQKKLMRDLRIEYRDFNEIENEPMNVDLGENLREQIRNIFAILNKNSIRF